MPLFVVQYRYEAKGAAVRDEHRTAHRAWLTASGSVKTGGAYVDQTGATIIVDLPGADVAAVQTFLADDPFVVNGGVAEITVKEWVAGVGDYRV